MSADLVKVNPLGRLPTLVTDDGDLLIESSLIVEYLDAFAGGGKIIPTKGADRWRVKRTEALADGLMDSAILVRYETFLRPAEKRWPEWIAGQQGDSPRRGRALFEKRGLMDSLHNQIIERKALALIREHAKITETSYEPERPTVFAADLAIGGRSEEEAAIPEAKYSDGGEEELKTPAERT